MKKQWRLLLVFGVGVALAASAFTWHLNGDNGHGIAFTAEVTEQQFGKTTTTDKFIAAFRPDGSNVWVRTIPTPDGKVIDRRTMLDVQGHKRMIVDGATESVLTYPVPAETNLSRLGKGCATIPNATRSTRLGYEVVLRVSEDHDKRYESWHAPALRCMALASTLSKKRSGKLEPIVVREVKSIRLGEPAAKLFNIPATYVERSPAEAMQEMSRRFNLNIPPLSPDSDMERRYKEER